MKRTLVSLGLIAVSVACGSSGGGTAASTSSAGAGSSSSGPSSSATGSASSGHPTGSSTTTGAGSSASAGTTTGLTATTGTAASSSTSGSTGTHGTSGISATSGTSGTSGSTAGTSTGTGTGSATGSSSTTGSTTGANCAATEFGGLQAINQQACAPGCLTDADCSCTQVCAVDPVLGQVCETPCVDDTQCYNAASFCNSAAVLLDAGQTASLCTFNFCSSQSPVGTFCSSASGPGSCIPSVGTSARVCMPNGSATTCFQGSNDNPLLGQYFLSVAYPQLADGGFCPADEMCLGGTCTVLCAPKSIGCLGTDVCLAVNPDDNTWGKCGPCVASAGHCYFDSDCCGQAAGACVGGGQGAQSPGSCM